MDIVNTAQFLDAVNARAGTFRQALQSLIDTNPDIFESQRGMGLMIGLKCRAPNIDVVNACYKQGLLTVPAGDNVLRLLPPLNIDETDIRTAIDLLDAAAKSLTS